MTLPRHATVFLLLHASAAMLSAQDSTASPELTRSGGLVAQFGTAPPQHHALRSWAGTNTVLREHLAWLNANVAFPQAVPVSFESCGVANAFYDPRTRQIRFCYEWITQRVSQAKAHLPAANDDALTDAVVRSMLFVINHETGHALIDMLGLPVLGREEDAADGFGAFILLERGGPQDAYSVLEGARSFGQHWLFENGNQADEHSLNDQRFYNIVCWMYGSDKERFGGYAQRGGLPASRQQRCPGEWAQLRTSWRKVLGPVLRTDGSRVAAAAVGFSAAPVPIVDNAQQVIPAGKFWQTAFHVNAAQCHATLNVLGVAGGNLDVETMLFEQPAFLSWQAGVRTAEPVFRSGRMRQLNTAVPIRGPGDFVVVVSNSFSTVTSKTFRATVRVACP